MGRQQSSYTDTGLWSKKVQALLQDPIKESRDLRLKMPETSLITREWCLETG